MEIIILLILAVLVANSFDLFAIRQPMLYNAQKSALENKIIECTIEKNGDQLYLFDKKTDSFVIQGKDLEEIEEKCKKHFPGINLYIDETDLA
jgi:uncharacterized protein YpmB